MHRNELNIVTFYAAFARLDPDAMEPLYAPDAGFDDEVFSLRGRDQVMSMWRMLCDATRSKGRDVWQLQYSDVNANAKHGAARWEAIYRFSGTGRMVHNIIQAEFIFNEAGQVIRHRDRFNFWRWSRQALGVSGLLLGGTPVLRYKVRKTAADNLRRFQAVKGGR